MARNWWEQDEVVQQPQSGGNWWEKDQVVGGNAPQQAQVPAGFDVNAPVADVQAALEKMPEAERKAAVRQWGEAAAKREKDQGFRPSWVATNILRGTPVGSWLDEGEAGLNAAIHWATGGKTGTPYELSKAQTQARFRQMDSEDTKLGKLPEFRVGTEKYGIDVGGDVSTGSLARLAGGAYTAGAAVRPFAGQTVLPATGNAIATGAVLGGVAGAGEGEGLKERGLNAAIGAGAGATIGGGAVPISYGIGGLYQLGREALQGTPQALQGYSRGAVDRVVRSATDDNLPVNYGGGERRQRLIQAAQTGNRMHDNLTTARIVRDTPNLGDEGMLLDMGPNMRGQASALYNMPGENRTVIGDALRTRSDTAPARIERQMDDVFGSTRFNERTARRAIEDANLRARPYYEQADNTPLRPQATPEVEALYRRAEAAGAVAEAERLMRIEGIDPAQARNTFRYLDYLKRAADDLASNAGPRTNGERIFGNLARDVRNMADRLLRQQGAVARDAQGNIIYNQPRPGTQGPAQPRTPYEEARGIGADARRLDDAIEAGQRAFKTTQEGVPYTAGRMQQDLAQLSEGQRIAYRAAARGTARDTTRQAATALRDQQDTAALKMFSSPDARDKVRLIARNTQGRSAGQRTDEFLNRLDAEAKFATSRNEITGNSATAGRIQAQREFPAATQPEDFRGIGNRSMFGTVMEYGLARPLNAILGGAISEARARTAADTARILTAQGATRDQIVQGILDVINRRNVSAAQRDQIRDLIAAALQAPRQQIIGANP